MAQKCPHCGAYNAVEAEFCQRCGKSLIEETQPEKKAKPQSWISRLFGNKKDK